MTAIIRHSPGFLGQIGKAKMKGLFLGKIMGTVCPWYVIQATSSLGIGLRTGLTIIVHPMLTFKGNSKV